MATDINPEFERWVVKQTFSGLDTPLSDGTKRLMQRAFEAGQKQQADQDAIIVESLDELRKAEGGA
jgi:hypothetical protein